MDMHMNMSVDVCAQRWGWRLPSHSTCLYVVAIDGRLCACSAHAQRSMGVLKLDLFLIFECSLMPDGTPSQIEYSEVDSCSNG